MNLRDPRADQLSALEAPAYGPSVLGQSLCPLAQSQARRPGWALSEVKLEITNPKVFDWRQEFPKAEPLWSILDEARERVRRRPQFEFDGQLGFVSELRASAESMTIGLRPGFYSQMRVLNHDAQELGVEGALSKHRRARGELWRWPKHLHLNNLLIISDGLMVLPRRNPQSTNTTFAGLVSSVSEHCYLAGPKSLDITSRLWREGQPIELVETQNLTMTRLLDEAMRRELGLCLPSLAKQSRMLALIHAARRGGVWVAGLETRAPEISQEAMREAWREAPDTEENLELEFRPLNLETVWQLGQVEERHEVAPLLTASAHFALQYSPALWAMEGERMNPESWQPDPRWPAMEDWRREVHRRRSLCASWLRAPTLDAGACRTFESWLEPLC